MSIRPILLLIFVLFLSDAMCLEGAKAPAWLERAIDAEIPSELGKADAVIICNEMVHEYGYKGSRQREWVRYAVKILQLDGREEADFRLYYSENSDKISDLEVWIIAPNKKPIRKRRKDFVDAVEENYAQLETENRFLRYYAGMDVRPGTVFAYSYVKESSSLFAEGLFDFSGKHPYLRSRLEVILPEGWDLDTHFLNNTMGLKHERIGRSWVWTSRNVPALVEEEWAPGPLKKIRLAYTALPPSNAHNDLLNWRSWSDVGTYTAKICQAPSRPTSAIIAKARALVANISGNWEKIEAISRFVQNINYISINIDVDRGGGYTPRSAEKVLNTGYGDCKDKATLMRSLLEAVGIRSYQVVVYSGMDMEFIPTWTSPRQFNHCILAIETDRPTDSEAVCVHPELGRLLIFDPTSALIPIGYLPDYLQGHPGVIGSELEDPLIQFPHGAAAKHRIDRSITAYLSEAGNLEGDSTTIFSGHRASDWRASYRNLNESDFRQYVANNIGDEIGRATVWQTKANDEFEENRFTLSCHFVAPSMARSMRGQMLIFQPAFTGRVDLVPPEDEHRVNDIRYLPMSFRETVRVTLPEGFVVDEQSADRTIEGPFGSYFCRTRIEEGVLIYERGTDFEPCTIPAADYEKIRAFYREMVDAEKAPVVLVRE